MYLLCISLFIKVIFYALRDFANNLEDAKSFLIIENIGEDLKTQQPITEFNLKPEYKKLNLDYYVKQYILCSKLTGYFQIYDQYLKLLTPYFNIIIYTLYLIGWSFIIYSNLLFCF